MFESIQQEIKKYALYADIQEISTVLQAKGYLCWLAGGAVRDLLLGHSVSDFDLVTDASIQTLKQLFPKAILVGESFGVIKVPVKQTEIDLATFRKEYEYLDGRHPSRVVPGTYKEDSLRRDFTVNALFWDLRNEVIIDEVGGLKDLEHKVLRTVGNPEERFLEDHLRVLRLLRFYVQLGFEIEALTLKSACKLVDKLDAVSSERIWEELRKIDQKDNYLFLYNKKIAFLIFHQIFKDADEVAFNASCLCVSKVGSTRGLYKLFYILLKISKDYEVLFRVLKSRLKVSNQELQTFNQLKEALLYIFNSDSNPDFIYELVYQIEKQPELLSVLYFLKNTQDLSLVVHDQIVKIYRDRPDILLMGSDLKGRLAPHLIGESLKKVRMAQFKGQVFTKQEAFVLLGIG